MTGSQHELLEGIYKELREFGAVQSTDDFSIRWLGMNESYLRCLRARQRQPSAKVLAHCAMRLRRASGLLTSVDQPPKVRAVATRMQKLADLCADAVFTEHGA